MHLFYTPDINEHPELTEEESGHAIRVLRLETGSQIQLTDGKGYYYKAAITIPHPKRCGVTILEKWADPAHWNFHLHMAVAPTKNMDRMEWFVEKSTEIGIDEISFLNCRYSERKEIKIPRLEKIAVSAMKQSGKAWLPVLNPMIKLKDFLSLPFEGEKYMAHCEPGDKKLLKDLYQPGQNALILIGPEGDFSKEEIEMALAAGFQPVSLGETRLRTETAALVGCHTIQLLNQ